MEDESWRANIEFSATGRPVGSEHTVRLYLENHPRLRNRVEYQGEKLLMDGDPLCEGHVHEVRAIMMQDRLRPTLEVVERTMRIVALNRATGG